MCKKFLLIYVVFMKFLIFLANFRNKISNSIETKSKKKILYLWKKKMPKFDIRKSSNT